VVKNRINHRGTETQGISMNLASGRGFITTALQFRILLVLLATEKHEHETLHTQFSAAIFFRFARIGSAGQDEFIAEYFDDSKGGY